MIHIRRIKENECSVLAELIKKGAEERGAEADYTAEALEKLLFKEGELKAYLADFSGVMAGYCLYQNTFSPYNSKTGYRVIDEYVLPDYRRNGLGKGFLQTLSMVALMNNLGFMEWNTEGCSEKDIKFYCDMGAELKSDRTVFSVSGSKLEYFSSHCACHK